MRRAGRIILTVLSVLILLAAVIVWLFGGYVLAAYHYTQATPAVRELGEQARLSLLGQRYYYAAAPTIVDKPAIQRACAAVAAEGLLGCFTGRIYLLDVESPEFRSETPVTAAHEMLHAAYDDLSEPERRRVEGLLQAELDHRQDPKVNERLNKYQDRESQLDEAFAILGSEAPGGSLLPELRDEFDQYFTDREAVVATNQRFQKAFDDLESRINGLNGQLAQRKQQLDELLAEDNIVAYNAQVNPYNNLVKEHNDLVRQYNDLGERFNRAIGGEPRNVEQR